MEPFAERFPTRFFNVGVAEQNLLGLATGLAESGFLPFVYSMTTFVVLRAYEFIRNGPIAHRLPVRIVGIGGGFEYVISPGWTAGLEYRHYDLGDEIYDRFTPAGAPVPGDRAIVDVGLDTISARVSWRWGRPDGGMAPLK